MNLKLKFSSNLSIQRTFLFLGGCLYFILLIWSYINLIVPRYSYMGYIYSPRNYFIYLISFLAAIFPLFWMPIRVARPSHVSYWFIYILVFFPSIIIPLFTTKLSSHVLVLIVAALTFSFWLLGVFVKLPLIEVKSAKISAVVFWLLFSLLVIASLYLLVASFGFSLNFIPLLEVYGVREQYQMSARESVRLASYLISWFSSVINPFLMIVGLVYKKFLFLALGFLFQFFIYSVTGFKSTFFSIVLISGILLGIYSHKTARHFGIYILLGTSLMISTCIIYDLFLGSYIPLSIFVRRLLITPGLLTGFYFEFFSENTKVFLSHSVLKGIIEYPYDRTPPLLIGLQYFNNPETSANANFWADSFANFGYSGLLIFTMSLGLFFWIFDSLSRHIDLRISATLLGVSSFSLVNSALLTSFMTHGLFLSALLLWIIPSKLFRWKIDH